MHINAAHEKNRRYTFYVFPMKSLLHILDGTHWQRSHPAMTPAQFDLMMKRIIAVGTPKESWFAIACVRKCQK